MAAFLDIYGARGSRSFWSDFLVFGILGFESRFRPVDQGFIRITRAMFRIAAVSVLETRDHFPTFTVNMVVGFFGRISDFRISQIQVHIPAVNRIYSHRAETMVDGLPRAFRFL